MNKLFTCFILLASFSAFSQKGKVTPAANSNDMNERVGVDKVQFHKMALNPDFCANFNKIIDSGKDQFTVLKGEKTTRSISGVDRVFHLSTVDLDKNHKGYIGESEQYPEYELVMSDNRFHTPEMQKDFDTLVGLVKSCLDPNLWVLQLKDASNDIYLEGTDFKKLVCRENKAGMKVKFELFMYNNRVRGYWVVEFHFDGIGKIPEKKAADGTTPK